MVTEQWCKPPTGVTLPMTQPAVLSRHTRCRKMVPRPRPQADRDYTCRECIIRVPDMMYFLSGITANNCQNCAARLQTGQTALHLAIEGASKEIVRALKRNGAKFSTPDKQGDNGLHYLARHGRADLLKFQDDCDWRRAARATNNMGCTPLHTLLQGSSVSAEVSEAIMSVIMKCGADTAKADKAGETPMDLAVVRCRLLLLEWLTVIVRVAGFHGRVVWNCSLILFVLTSTLRARHCEHGNKASSALDSAFHSCNGCDCRAACLCRQSLTCRRT
jgi:hypothetical protein